MYGLSVHLPTIAPGELSEEEIETRQKVNIKILNLLRRNGFEAYYRNAVLNTVVHISRGGERIVFLNKDAIWAVNEFDIFPTDILEVINNYSWITYTLQKIEHSPSH